MGQYLCTLKTDNHQEQIAPVPDNSTKGEAVPIRRYPYPLCGEQTPHETTN
jgi:hypothetical protein